MMLSDRTTRSSWPDLFRPSTALFSRKFKTWMHAGSLRIEPPTAQTCTRHALLRPVFDEQLGELFGHDAAELLGIDDGDGAPIVARHVMADADGDQFDRGAGLDILDHPAQMALEIVAGIDRQRRIVDRRAV